MYRVALLMAVIVGSLQSASAQTTAPASADAEQQRHGSKEPHVILEIRRLEIPEEAFQRIRKHFSSTIPKEPGCSAVFDENQTKRLNTLAEDCHGAMTLPTRRQNSGENVPLSNVAGESYADTIQATVSDDRQTIHICLARRWPDGSERYPAMRATVPVGSSLLFHMSHIIDIDMTISDSPWQRFLDWVAPNRPMKTASSEGFLLISPRIAPREERDARSAVK